MFCSAPTRTGLVHDIVSRTVGVTDRSVPDEPHTELSRFSEHLQKHGSHLLLSYAQFEVKKQDRVVCIDEESGWVAVVPFWATWPYELLGECGIVQTDDSVAIQEAYSVVTPTIVGRARRSGSTAQGCSRSIRQPVQVGHAIATTDLSCPFPYSMGLHQSPLPPTDPESDPAEVHFHFYPPLLRSASVRKFMVGFEMMGEVQVSGTVNLY